MKQEIISFADIAKNIENKEKHPIAIIGSGIGGLMAGACLARNGFPVTIFEKHYQIGGFATSFYRKGFNFDISLHAMAARGPAIDPLYEEAGVLNKIEPVLLPELARIITPEFEISFPKQDIKAINEIESPEFKEYITKVINSIAKQFPEDIESIQKFVGKMLELLKILLDADFEKLYEDPIAEMTLKDYLDQITSNPWLKTILGAFCMYFGKSPKELPAVLYLALSGGLYTCGSWIYKRRSEDFTKAFIEVIEENGGKILPCAEVTKILLEEDIAMGVEYKDGYSGDKMKTFKAEAVIANSNIPDTIFKLLPREKVPLDYKKKINEYETSQSIFCLWLGLNEDISKKVEGYEIFLYNTPNDDEDLKAINTCDPVEVSCSIINYNNAYNGYTNESGTSVLGIFFPCSYEPWREFEEDYFNGNKESYNKKKDFITDVLIKRVEESILPGLREMIKVKEAATPLTIVRYTDNKDGAILGYRQTLNNYGQKRIKDSPFKGLYYSSAWGLPGGGYNGVLWGGYAAVYELLNDLLNEEE